MPPAARPSAPPCPPPLVVTRGRRRTLEFVPGEVQSEMHLDHPDRLLLSYCRAIMCFALFVPQPRHIVMLGLGGGSLLKFCHRHFPAARITVLELRADVIALRSQFAIPPDDARLSVIHADGAAWLEAHPDCADVLIVDAFDRGGLPQALGSARFYGHCRRALHDGGVLVANIFSYDSRLPRMLARLSLIFDSRVCWMEGVAANNRLLFAVRDRPALTAGAGARALRVQQWLAARRGLGARWANRLLVRAVVAWLTWRPGRSERQQ